MSHHTVMLCVACSAAVKKALGVDEEAEWEECNMLINAAFYGERPWFHPWHTMDGAQAHPSAALPATQQFPGKENTTFGLQPCSLFTPSRA